MAKQEMKITVSPSGEVNIEVLCATGNECLKTSQFLEEALGNVVARDMKASSYLTSPCVEAVEWRKQNGL